MTPTATQETFPSLRGEWAKALNSNNMATLFLTPNWQEVWWERFGTPNVSVEPKAELLLLAIREGQKLLGIAPMMRKDLKLSFLGDSDLFDYHDFVVTKDEEERFYPALLDTLADQSWEQLYLSSVPHGSPTLSYLPWLAQQRGWSCDLEREDVAPGLALPTNWETYLSFLKKKDRHELRRKFRRLYNGVPPLVHTYTNLHQLTEHMESFFTLMKKGHHGKNAFLTSQRKEFFTAMAYEQAVAGRLRLYFMELGNEQVAATLCLDYQDQCLLYNSGFDPEYASLSVGLLLVAMCLREALERGIAYFDFLRGDEPYKYDLGGQDRPIYHIELCR